MPQPLNKVAPNSGVIIDHDAMAQRPELAGLVAQTISAWSLTELMLGNFLAKMLGTSAQKGIAMYSAIDAFQPQMRALDAAASTFFDGEDRRLYETTMRVIRRAARTRHAFAHNIWGVSHQLPDALLLVEPDVIWAWTAECLEWGIRVHSDSTLIPKAPTPPDFDNSKVLVYRRVDFEEAIARTRRSTWLATQLAQMEPSIPHVADTIRRLLRGQPEIRSALAKDIRCRTSSLSTSPKAYQITDPC